MEFFILDVFAESKFQGNQLAVFLDFDRTLTHDTMLQITREMNYSESTFILSSQAEGEAKGEYDVRIFTPGSEIPFAGHPTVGTAYAVHKHILRTKEGESPQEIVLHYPLQDYRITVQLPTSFSGVYKMKTGKPTFLPTKYDAAEMATVLGLGVDDLDRSVPVQMVTTGLPAIIVKVASLNAVQRASCSASDFDAYLDKHGVGDKETNLLIFTTETSDPAKRDLHVRVFCTCFSIPEDPATGSASSCLAAYCLAYGILKNSEGKVKAVSEQGIEMNRPSVLHLEAAWQTPSEGCKNGKGEVITGEQDIDIHVAGQVVEVVTSARLQLD